MTSGQEDPNYFSKTPPNQGPELPPTPPDTGKRSRIASVGELHRYWDAFCEIKGDTNNTQEILLSSDFDPHLYEDDIRSFLPRFDCFATKPSGRGILIRMPSRIHEGFIAYIEEQSYRQLSEQSAQRFKIEIGRSSRVLLHDGKQSRQPDTQYLDSEDVPRVIVEVAYTQSGKQGRKIARDYISGTDGKVKRVYVCDLNRVGKASTISEWEGRITPSEDPNYDGDLSVVMVRSKEFRAADGSPANQDESMNIPCCDFKSGSDGQDAITIKFRSLYDILEELENKGSRPYPNSADEPPAKRFRFRRHSSTSTEQLRVEEEERFLEAEDAAAREESDFQPSTEDPESNSSSQASPIRLLSRAS